MYRLISLWGSPAMGTVFERNNRAFLFVIAIGPAVLGSIISVLVWSCFVWNFGRLCVGKMSGGLTKAELRFCYMMACYPCALFITSIIAPNALTQDWLFKLVPGLIFFAPLFFLRRFGNSDSNVYRRIFVVGASVGVIISILGAVAVQLFSYDQPEGMAGNSYPFAISVMVAGSIAVMLDNKDGRPDLLGFGAFLLSILCVILSEARGVMICIPLLLVLFILCFRPHLNALLRRRFSLAVLAFCFFVLLVFAPTWFERLSLVFSDVARYLNEGDSATSIGKRLALWSGSLPIVENSPIIGNGIQNRSAMFALVSLNSGADLYKFNHFHNIFINALMDGGLILVIALLSTLFAPVIFVIGSANQIPDQGPKFAAFALVTIYGFSGMTGPAFGHDILDALFVVMATFIVFMSSSTTQIK